MIGPKAYIHLDRLKNNIRNIRKNIGDRSLIVVVKANGYGHGYLNISKHLAGESDIIFAVFTIDEAIKLRKEGVKCPILIFSKIQKEWLEFAYKHKLWINACDYEDLKLLSQVYDEKGFCPEIHLEFDT
ncbi:MAG: alanine racemase, partial [Candidatus Neomarinimicrobiota bacterium]